MIQFTAPILKFSQKGDKSGWTYIEIPVDIAVRLSSGRKSFRVKGLLDLFPISGIALLPMGEGMFILPMNEKLRKGTGKGEGAILKVALELDKEFSIETPAELSECFEDEPAAGMYFYSLAKSHREYFIKWIESAKTPETRMKRLVNTCTALINKQTYSEMIRSLKMR